MDIEFHYYMTYIIARRAGFNPDDSYLIACSSQYTDDNTEHLYISQDTPDAYESYISQTVNILKPQKELMRIYPVFHFLPGSLAEIAGDSTRRADGKLHLMNTVPDSLAARKVLTEALGLHDPYRIGIATHMYSDAFAHQNFVGADDGFNDMAGLLEKLIPSVGHADAKHSPDIPNKLWQDKRLVPSHASIDNKPRFLDAAGCLFDLYRGHFTDDDARRSLLADLGTAIGDSASTKTQRIGNYKALIGGEFIKYKEDAWFKDAVGFTTANTSVGGDTVPGTETRWGWKDNYKESHWFKFQEAVKTHQAYVLTNIVRPIYATMEQTTW
ncbi:MAG: hypothetical protein PHT96_15165 [Syntrophorhabdaceae bacterium]|mgnify:CR=1 FL=1|nr:hypothetical protein [Syntrophorhabdaceae bacterium]